jgi:M6 family metalloprotease-like protein
MKKFVFFFVCCLAAFPSSAFAQTDFSCATVPPAGESINPTETRGIYLPAQGDLKILVVFARFKDDTTPHNEWPAGSGPPGYTTWIDPTMQTGSTNLENFTHYFKTMSIGTFRVTGTAISVETPQNRSYYFALPNPRYEANKDILQNKVDPLVNFADFDNWTFNSNYNHTNQPDGTVDMIVMIWRGFAFASNWGGEASLGYGAPFTVENGTKTIAAGFRGYGQAGSGVTVHYSGTAYRKYNFHSAVHEVAHWLLGGAHPYDDFTAQRYGFWGMLTSSFVAGLCANTYERERLGWINPTPVTSSSPGSLTDFITTGIAYKYRPSGGATNEWYYFENHQKLSIYDDATTNVNDKGIWVIHQLDVYNGTNNIRLKPQDGFWNWENPYYNTTCFPPNTIGVFRRLSVNRNTAGLSIRDQLLNSNSVLEWPHAYLGHMGSEICGGFFRGDLPFYGAYNTTLNNLFSRWSNPTANTWTDATVDLAMEVLSQSGSTITVRFYVGNPLDASPSKPQNLRGSYAGNGHVNLNWVANLEPDMSQYRIYRDGQLVQTVSHSTTSWTDSVTATSQATYTVKAVDTQAKESALSEAAVVVINPSSPRNLTHVLVPNGSNYNPKLIWNKNPESNIVAYDLHRWRSEEGIWRKVATITHPETTYVDGEILVSALGRDNTNWAEYKVQAFNTASVYSPISNIRDVAYWITWQKQLPSDLAAAATVVPEAFEMSQNFPNPFNPETKISFALPEPSTVRLTVLDVLGREIVVLEDGLLPAGHRTARWNGRNAKGEPVGSGVYFYRITALGESGKTFSKTMKMLVTK